jgi:hypothetical protein
MKMNTDKTAIIIDLAVMPTADKYEDAYQQYMGVFRVIAEAPPEKEIFVLNAPWSWHPLLKYLLVTCVSGQNFFTHDGLVKQSLQHFNHHDRTVVEVLCGFRPELVDALWKCDMQWRTRRPRYTRSRNFIVTNNGSFHRGEVTVFMDQLDAHRSKAKGCVLVPCAADKPYPSPLHKQVKSMMPESWDLCIATGVLGIVPEDTWHEMPYYDSGIPNEWRLMQRAIEYFSNNNYEHAVVYVDFYSLALAHAVDLLLLKDCPTKFYFVNPVRFYADYMDLLDEHHLNNLQEAIDLPQLLEEQDSAHNKKV